MKQLTCEMCGSTDIIKQDGVFLCQSCGCKYSVEEAKKMMIDGIVEVQGMVTVNRTPEVTNILKNADATYEDGNYKEAFDLYSQVISYDPDNEHAILYRAMSSAWQSSVKDCKIGEINRAAERAIRTKHEKSGDSEEFFDFAWEALSKVALIINAISNMYISYYNQAMPTNLSITGAIATSGFANQVNSIMRKGILDCCTVAQNLVNYIIIVTENYAEADKNFWDMMELYPQNCKTYRKNAHMDASSSDQKLIDEISELRRKGEIDAKTKKKEILAKYWKEHPEEMSKLEAELFGLRSTIEQVESQITNIPEKVQIEDYENQILNLNTEKKALGLFKGKEKKAIQKRIDKIEKEKISVQKTVKDKVALLNDQCSPLKQRANEILKKLGKNPEYRNVRGTIEIKTNRAGKIKEINVDQGTFVKRGDPICWLSVDLDIGGIRLDELPVCIEEDDFGEIASVEVKIGDEVKKGQVVATLV